MLSFIQTRLVLRPLDNSISTSRSLLIIYSGLGLLLWHVFPPFLTQLYIIIQTLELDQFLGSRSIILHSFFVFHCLKSNLEFCPFVTIQFYFTMKLIFR